VKFLNLDSTNIFTTLKQDLIQGFYYIEAIFTNLPSNASYDFTLNICVNFNDLSDACTIDTDFDMQIRANLFFNNRPFIFYNEKNNVIYVSQGVKNYIPVSLNFLIIF